MPELLGLDHGMAHSSLLEEFSILLPEFREEGYIGLSTKKR